ncbi:MAG TPA: hypothetical protein VK023_04110 [Sphingobacterium bovisgrunnientis]|jgi:Spy/CpxP family protein refolding chaperone|nr:hypothetical protein [Sphingobacterium bovisgrunnientis]
MKSVITLLALVLSLGLANAQQDGPRQQRTPEEMTKMQMERLTKELNLTQTQQDSIKKYVLASSVEMQKVFSNAGDDREAAMNSMRAIREKQTKKVKTFLNEEQGKKYDEIASQRGRGFGGQRPNN